MTKWAGLLLGMMVGVQAVGAELTVDQRRALCLENFAKAEQQLAVTVTELQTQKTPGKVMQVGSGLGWFACVAKFRTIPMAVACTGLFGMTGAVGYTWNDALDAKIKKAQETATIMSVYTLIKNGDDNSDEVRTYLNDLKINPAHDQFAKQNVIQFMENGSLCDFDGNPKVTYEEFLSYTRPGDL